MKGKMKQPGSTGHIPNPGYTVNSRSVETTEWNPLAKEQEEEVGGGRAAGPAQ